MPPLNLDLTDADREALQPFLDPMYGSEQQTGSRGDLARRRDGHTAPEGVWPAGGGAVQEAGAPGGGGVRVGVEGEEGGGLHDCRGCALRVWVARGVAMVEVVQAVPAIACSRQTSRA